MLHHNVCTALCFYRVHASSRPLHVYVCCICVTEFQVRSDMERFPILIATDDVVIQSQIEFTLW